MKGCCMDHVSSLVAPKGFLCALLYYNLRHVPTGDLSSQDEIALKASLAGPLKALQEGARMIADTQAECKLDISPDDYVESFRPTLMDVVFAWSQVSHP